MTEIRTTTVFIEPSAPLQSPLIGKLRNAAFRAIEARDVRALSEILKKVDDPRVLDTKAVVADWSDSLLEWSIKEEAIDCARLLLESGADPMWCGQGSGIVSVHVLAYSAVDMEEGLVRAFVDLLHAAGGDFNAKAGSGWTPLQYAIYNGASKLAEILIERGVDVDAKLLDPETAESEILPESSEEEHPKALEALRRVRSMVMERRILSAMDADPAANASSRPDMTL